MKKIKFSLAVVALAALTLGVTSCKGRTQENAEATGDTQEISAGVVDMPSSDTGNVIAESPAEAAAQQQDAPTTPDAAPTAPETAPGAADANGGANN